MVDLTSVFQVRLKKKIRELIKEDADALYAFKGRGFSGKIGVVTPNIPLKL
tara:strand:- start:23 stop:175 length:153 start_codon:yes stop_codon:yes gene_type:complete